MLFDWSPEGYGISLMRNSEAAPGEQELDAMADQIRNALLSYGGPYRRSGATPGEALPPGEKPPAGDLNPVIWGNLLKLTYRGNAHLAAALFDRAWPDGVEGKRAFWRDFVTQMKSSVIWQPWNLGETLDPEMHFGNGG